MEPFFQQFKRNPAMLRFNLGRDAIQSLVIPILEELAKMVELAFGNIDLILSVRPGITQEIWLSALGRCDARFRDVRVGRNPRFATASKPAPAGGVPVCMGGGDRKSTRLNSSHSGESRMPSSA